jgi:hypothetical protein
MSTTVRVHLLEGFDNDDVVVLFSGDEVFSRKGVTTAAVTGSASYFEAVVSAQSITVEVRLTRRGLRHSLDLDLANGRDIGVNVEGGRLSLFQSKTPIGAM